MCAYKYMDSCRVNIYFYFYFFSFVEVFSNVVYSRHHIRFSVCLLCGLSDQVVYPCDSMSNPVLMLLPKFLISMMFQRTRFMCECSPIEV